MPLWQRRDGNFFGTLKAEYLYWINPSYMAEIERAVAEYVQSNNFGFIDLKNCLTPLGIRSEAT